MGLRFQKRVSIGKGLGINLGKTGVSSISKKTFFGSIGTSGFSLKTGIPGLQYRSKFNNSGFGSIIVLFIIFIGAIFWIIIIFFKLFILFCFFLFRFAIFLLKCLILIIGKIRDYYLANKKEK